MAFGTQDDTDEVMNEINMTPLVDVMLVLLIIFMVTIPVLQHAIPVQLPQVSSTAPAQAGSTLVLSVDASGRYFIDTDPTDLAGLETRLQAATQQNPQPTVQIRGHRDAAYEPVVVLMEAARRSGLTKVAIMTSPDHRP
jgi:biopolymer transport protein ExbD